MLRMYISSAVATIRAPVHRILRRGFSLEHFEVGRFGSRSLIEGRYTLIEALSTLDSPPAVSFNSEAGPLARTGAWSCQKCTGGCCAGGV